MRTRLFIPTLALLGCVTPLVGCSTEPFCEEHSKCGGDFTVGKQDMGTGVPSVEWVANATDACIDQVPNPPEPPSLAYIPPRPAGIRAFEPSTIDWCAGLVINAMGEVTAFNDGWYETLVKYDGWFPSIPLYTAQLTIYENNQYSVALTQLVSQHTELTQTCLIAQGIVMTCSALNERLGEFVADRLSSINGLTATVYDNVCTDDGKGGCNCDYNVSLTSGQKGPWSTESGRIAFFDAEAAPPGRADYCMSGASLQLTGTKGTDLFNRGSLKTLTLRPPSCNDGVQSLTLGEEGPDCGGSCPEACP
jgi:hypothetical protein